MGRVSGARRLLFPAQPLQLGPEGHPWGLPVGMLGGSSLAVIGKHLVKSVA